MESNRGLALGLVIPVLLMSISSVSFINSTPLNVPSNQCVLDATVVMRAGQVGNISWKAGTYNLYACGDSTDIASSPVQFCTQVFRLEQPVDALIFSCLESS